MGSLVSKSEVPQPSERGVGRGASGNKDKPIFRAGVSPNKTNHSSFQGRRVLCSPPVTRGRLVSPVYGTSLRSQPQFLPLIVSVVQAMQGLRPRVTGDAPGQKSRKTGQVCREFPTATG